VSNGGNHIRRSSFYYVLKSDREVCCPTLFSVYIDGLVDKVSACNVGCNVSCITASILFMPMTLFYWPPAITAFELFLRACESELKYLDMQIYVRKSLCVYVSVLPLILNARICIPSMVTVFNGPRYVAMLEYI
jgi:hypothetical protein